MPKMHIDKSILINKSADEIYANISDFNNWESWSPWLILDNKTKVSVAEGGKFYEWESAITGSGNMRVLSEDQEKRIDIQLTFLKPWKSTANVAFTLNSKGESTEVHWIMNSKLPFFMFFFKKMMEVFVGMDFSRGLIMLKEQMEEGTVNTSLTVEGIRNIEGIKYIGIKASGKFSDVKELMGRDFGKLMKYAGENLTDKKGDYSFTILHQFSPVKDYMEYTAGVPVLDFDIELPEGFVKGEIPATKMHVIRQKGSYKFIGNVWSAQTSRFRSKVFKVNKKIAPMEVYLNNPQNTPETELETEIWYPAL